MSATEPKTTTAAPPPRENLVRAVEGITLDRSAGLPMPTLTGHFAVWDSWTEIRSAYEGNFMERFSRGSMAKTLSESVPKVLFQHGKDPQIGEKPLGNPERVTPDDSGAYYVVPLFDTSYNRDLVPGLEAGVYGASFRFSVVNEDFVQRPSKSGHNPRGLPERTVQEARVMEFGPVTFPAYKNATAGLRSMTDEFLFDTLAQNPEHLREMSRGKGISLHGAARFDNDDIGTLAQMVQLGSCFIDAQDDGDVADATAQMQSVVKSLTAMIPAEISEPEPDEENSAAGEGEERAVWTTEYMNDLPDSAFLYVEAGGKKDSDGKTVPRSLRHFPVRDATGKVDLPHLRNALARIPQSDLPQTVKDAATAQAQKLLAAENGRSEPEPPEATTPTEPEPSVATTHSDRGLFWLVDPTKTRRSK